jgi:predicted AAA+ superfamily ATPase
VEYQTRVVDQQLDVYLAGLPAVAIEGVKGVGKTATGLRHAAQVVSLDQSGMRRAVEADPESILAWGEPLLIDEWQLVPGVWDVVRRAVDQRREPGRFILAGSALPPPTARIHSGAGRIVTIMIRPMTLPERLASMPTVSLTALLAGGRPPVSGRCDLRLADYTEEIAASGLPGIRQDPPHLRAAALASYLDQSIERDIPELGADVRRPRALRAWLAAYAAATATTTSYAKILDAATGGDANKPVRNTAAAYREMLQRIWLLEPLEAWIPAFNPLKRLSQAPKHHLADPALAASLLHATPASLLRAEGPGGTHHEGNLLGALFESLVTQSVRVFAQPERCSVFHLRSNGGEHEVDLIVQRPDHKILAIEVKLTSAPTPTDAKHLNWLEREIGDSLVDKAIVCTSQFAYRQEDGTAIIPLGLLGA